MGRTKKNIKAVKPTLHVRNKHKGRYDLQALAVSYPELRKFIIINEHGKETIDFFLPQSVVALNKAILLNQYGVSFWDLPEGYLCPPIPGRADYIHHVADLIKDKNFGRIPLGNQIKCLDIGVGANCIYPIVGVSEYDWSFIGSDIDHNAITSAEKIVAQNQTLEKKVEIRMQENKKDFLYGILDKEEKIDLTICNPPFHSSKEEAAKGSAKKVSNLKKEVVTTPVLNFSGQHNELWTEGGEERFIRNMMKESKKFGSNCFWFTSLVSKGSHLRAAEKYLQKLDAQEIKVIPMGQGNKSSRLIAWTFLSPSQQAEWIKSRWKLN